MCQDGKASRWNRITAISAMFVALISLVVSIYDSLESREFKRLGMEPRIVFGAGSNDEGAWFSVRNVGLGPAYVKWFSVKVDGEPKSNWDEVLTSIGVSLKGGYSFKNLYDGSFLRPIQSGSKQGRFLTLPKDERVKTFITNWKRISVKACYCSVYKDCKMTGPEKAGSNNWIDKNFGNRCDVKPDLKWSMPPSFYKKNGAEK